MNTFQKILKFQSDATLLSELKCRTFIMHMDVSRPFRGEGESSCIREQHASLQGHRVKVSRGRRGEISNIKVRRNRVSQNRLV